MKKSVRPVWMMPALITGSVAALGAIGTLAVKSATYITLPDRVEAAIQKNDVQDESLTKLGTIAEQNQRLLDRWDSIYQQQQQAPNQAAPQPRYRYWTDDRGQCWRCDVRYNCEQNQNWSVCE